MAPLAIICAGGSIPFVVADAARKSGRDIVLFAIKGIADERRVGAYPHVWIGVGQYGRFLRQARERGCQDVTLIGFLTRPTPWKVAFDLGGLARLPRLVGGLFNGDDHLLRAVALVFERDGFRVIGAHELAPEILMPVGALTDRAPSAAELADIGVALDALRARGQLDLGQGAIVADGEVLAFEGAEGTDGLLQQMAARRNASQAAIGILVKAPKPMQDRRFDLPTVGPGTVVSAERAGLVGIAVVAGESLIADRTPMIEAANRVGMFVCGIKGGSDGNAT